MIANVAIADLEQEGVATAVAAREHFESWCQRHRLPQAITHHRLDSVFAIWSEEVGELEPIVALRGRLHDLIVLRRPATGEIATRQAFDAAVFETGRPTLLAPDRPPAGLLAHALVAWNGSREAALAVAGAMQLLHNADRVSVFTAPRHPDAWVDGKALVEALAWHGIRADFVAGPDIGNVGEALLQTTAERAVSMLVAGAYTHSRVRQMWFSGVAQHVLTHATITIGMAH